VVQRTNIPSVRGRIIPGIAIAIVVGLLALMAWTLLGPKADDVAQNGRINAPGVFIPFTNRTAPNFTVTDFTTGKKINLTDFRGKTVILNFWASWCVPCQTEAPLLSAYNANNNSSNVVVIGIAAWDVASDSKTFLQQYDLNYLNGPDSNGTIAIAYGVAGVPETFIVGPDGKLMGKFPGAVTSPNQLVTALNAINGG
jgi:cytochrome c biogenesis protein CcmG, thiol:disulfide interchange protein DsbE